MKYSFENLEYEFDFAHDGIAPIFFSRADKLSTSFAFNFLDFVKIPVNSGIGMHTHAPDNQEIYVLISGNGQMTVNGNSYHVKEGDVVVNPIGGSHQLINCGDEEILLVVIEASNTKSKDKIA